MPHQSCKIGCVYKTPFRKSGVWTLYGTRLYVHVCISQHWHYVICTSSAPRIYKAERFSSHIVLCFCLTCDVMAKKHVENSLEQWNISGTIQKSLEDIDNGFHHAYANTVMTKLQTAWSHCLVKEFSNAMADSSIIQDIVWEQLHHGDWKDVPTIWRTLYSHSSLLISLCHISNGQLTKAMMELDKALLMGTPILDNYIQTLAAQVSNEITLNDNSRADAVSDNMKKSHLPVKHLNDQSTSGVIRPKKIKLDNTKSGDTVSISGDKIIKRIQSPSLNDFLLKYMSKDQPVILMNCMDHWPARSKWSLNYLKEVAGPRIVPVELGSRYTDDDWSQQLMNIKTFIENYIENPEPGGPVGYLAQHTLFDQIPQLKEDIIVPDYCCLTTTSGSDDIDNPEVKINAWFGPAGTVSPLHYDPEHNLLSQVVGSKYIRLYPADQSDYLYPCKGIMSNTSQVDIENPDLQEFPQFTKAVCLECVLLPGEMLYIPPKCWHFVRSLETSFSVSMWWS